MRQKERERVVPQFDVPIGRVSAPPVFDMEEVWRAREFTGVMGVDNFKALDVALALVVYNFDVEFSRSTGRSAARAEGDLFLRRFSPLVSHEMKAYRNPRLPTIGFEVESPRKLFDQKRDYPKFGEFFDTLGMPRNKANKTNANSYWEFSPWPSYDARVEMRILSELIRGRFIPTLINSQEPSQIRRWLDEKLVSLHINLGIPSSACENFSAWSCDKEIFASALALAFTSSERLSNRRQTIFVDIKAALPMRDGQLWRLEVKALEVRDGSVYRLVREAQLLAAALFSWAGSADDSLAKLWKETRREIEDVFIKYGIQHDIVKIKAKASEQVRTTDISQFLREILDRRAIEIARLVE